MTIIKDTVETDRHWGALEEEELVEELVPAEEPEEEAVEEAEPAEIDRSDPAQAYLREMGAIPLLKPDEEVRLASTIREGRDGVIRAVSESGLGVRHILRRARQVEGGLVAFDAVFGRGDDGEDAPAADPAVITRTLGRLKRLAKRPDRYRAAISRTAGEVPLAEREAERLVKRPHPGARRVGGGGEKPRKRALKAAGLVGLKPGEVRQLSQRIAAEEARVHEAKDAMARANLRLVVS